MRACSIEGCGRRLYGRNLCNLHYQRLRKTGSPTGSNRGRRRKARAITSLADRFWRKVLCDIVTGCWLFQGRPDGHGYGQIFAVVADGKRTMRKAHHVALEIAGIPVPSGKCALHLCDTPLCVRPDHLRIGTRAENSLDMAMKGRWANGHLRGPAYT